MGYSVSLTSVTRNSLRVESRFRVLGKSVLKRIFGHMKEQVTGGQTKLHNELHNFYYSPNIIRMIKPKGMAAYKCMEETNV